jgi:hypothetical protein
VALNGGETSNVLTRIPFNRIISGSPKATVHGLPSVRLMVQFQDDVASPTVATYKLNWITIMSPFVEQLAAGFPHLIFVSMKG